MKLCRVVGLRRSLGTVSPNAHCGYCGAPHQNTAFPRTCGQCSNITYVNAIPVSVALIPVRQGNRVGLLTGRRGIAPGMGLLAHLGGFVEEEDVFAAVARECKEEAGLTLDPKLFRPFWFCSSAPRPNRVLLFSAYSSVLDVDAVKKDLRPTAEMTDFQVIHRDFQASEFAFPLHAQAAKKFFDQKD